ncbi:hypothetical protein [Cellulomonas wangsupingiae]|uniref:Uncharacterized protein n=1 Tax=Cellulomonas wangsupingiae TaxID=2968085 RepID=A0ABY5K5F7_9CELL|nr:hypothetical protein [Cellulomonas wangsupingiae]MCC2336334.1 hypothetical protein [Cellulomonas wangsupingiae]UUI65689.1 hypothetical protein NP075_02830 [Cellulomonas wangsupingiae]
MPYTADKPPLPETPEQLRARIPGWGADLDPADRPQVPRERFDLPTGAHWDFPDRQPETYPRERSIEHEMLTPVFGTAQPPHGLAGRIRRYSYERFSEGRAAHWLLLMAADRVDAAGAHLRSMATLRPDNPITETGVLSELHRHPVASRRGRVDVRHQVLDPLIVGGPWIVGAAVALMTVRALRRRG